MKRLAAGSEMDAAPAEVWSVLTDFEHHPDWNPFIRSITGSPVLGARLAVTLVPPGGRATNLRPVVCRVEPGRELGWLGRFGFRGLFSGEHTFRIEPLPDGRSRFVQAETFRGLLVPLLSSVLTKTEEGFRVMNAALADEVVRRRRPSADDAGQADGDHSASWIESATTGSSSCSTWRNSKPASSA